jgi:hypothetical protein
MMRMPASAGKRTERGTVENQHKMISGYRDLTAAEINVINVLKAEGARLAEILERIKALPNIDARALAIARTELQTGMMWAVRAVARPEGF